MLIYEKIPAIMAEMPAVGKNQKNQQQGFSFRGIDDVMNALAPLLAKHQVFIAPEVISTETTDRVTKNGSTMTSTVATVKYTFYTTDGSSVSCTVIGEGRDSGDKSSPKAMAIAMKYALFQTFCIPTEEMRLSDPDRETVPESVKADRPAPVKPSAARSALAEKLNAAPAPVCEVCGGIIADTQTKHGRIISAASAAQITREKYGAAMCAACAGKLKAELEQQAAAAAEASA